MAGRIRSRRTASYRRLGHPTWRSRHRFSGRFFSLASSSSSSSLMMSFQPGVPLLGCDARSFILSEYQLSGCVCTVWLRKASLDSATAF